MTRDYPLEKVRNFGTQHNTLSLLAVVCVEPHLKHGFAPMLQFGFRVPTSKSQGVFTGKKW